MQQVETAPEVRTVSGPKTDRFKGIWMVLLGATLWGVSGTAAQVLLQHYGFTVGWLVTMRMSISGVLLLMMVSLSLGKKHVFSVWKSKQDGLGMVVFGVFGLLGVQYSYFAAIFAGNAATATLLQYLGPAFITIYVALRLRRFPTWRQQAAVALAFIGTGLLVTNGNWRGLSISAMALVWGLLSALTAAFYTVYPEKLVQKYGAATVVGWAMAVGGVVLCFINPPWRIQGQFTPYAVLLILFVILFGTLAAFYLYLGGLHYISPSEVSVLGCAEPLSAAIIGVVFLNVNFSVFGIVGGICIVATVIILSRSATT